MDTTPVRPSRTPAGDAFSILVIQVFQLNGVLTAASDALAKPAGQTTARWQVLAAIEDEPASVAQIARALHLARQSVQRIADLLVADDLARYEDNPAHRRAKLLRMTGTGSDALSTIQAAQRLWADEVGRAIGERRLRQARRSSGSGSARSPDPARMRLPMTRREPRAVPAGRT